MAIGTPTQIGAASSAAAVNSIVITTTVAVPAGASIIVPVTVVRNAGPTAVTDSAGNTYTQDVLKDAGSDVRGAIYSAHNVTALPSGGTITITVPNATYTKSAWAFSVTGLATASTRDKTTSSSGTSGAWSSGATATLSQADEIGLALAVYASTGANTPDSGWTELVDVSNAELKRNVVEYQIVASTAALTAGGSFTGGSALWGGMLATYKAAASSTVFTQTLAVTSTPTATRNGAVGAQRPATSTPTAERVAAARATPTVTMTSTTTLTRLAAAVHGVQSTAAATRAAVAAAARSVTLSPAAELSRVVGAVRAATSTPTTSLAASLATLRTLVVTVGSTVSVSRGIDAIRQITSTPAASLSKAVGASRMVTVIATAASSGVAATITRLAVRYRLTAGTRTPAQTATPGIRPAPSLTASTRPRRTLEAE